MDRQLRRLQLEQLGILKVIDAFCRQNGIRYSLYAGTLLGAVRHRGFIPWDDDLDICMERSQYETFLGLWREIGPAGYILQNKDNTPRFTQSFSKIRKDHTVFLQEAWEGTAFHTGIFVDVFPIDRLPERPLERMRFRWDCLRYQLYNREFIPPKGTFVQKAVSRMFLAAVPPGARGGKRTALLKRITRRGDDKKLDMVAIETVGTIRKPLPADMMDSYVEIPFEDAGFMCMAGWDAYLRAKYGDYMTLPPEAERIWKHHPLLIDFEHDYCQLQKTDADRIP